MSLLSKRLIYLRELQDLSQASVAKVLRMSPNGYSSYESGRTTPPPDTIIKLADFYKVSTDFVLGYEPENKEFDKMIKNLQSLSPDRQQKLAEIIHLYMLDMAYEAEQQRRAERKQQRLSKTSPEEPPQDK